MREQRRQAVKDKWKKFATDAQYREDYITRLHSVKTIAPVSGTAARTKPTDDRPKAVLVHHVPRKSATPPAGEYPGSTNYFTNRPSRSFNETPTDTRHDGADQNFTTTPNQSEWNYVSEMIVWNIVLNMTVDIIYMFRLFPKSLRAIRCPRRD